MLAKASFQPMTTLLTHRFREQARSHWVQRVEKKALPSRQRFFLINPLLFFLSFHYIPQRIQFRLAE